MDDARDLIRFDLKDIEDCISSPINPMRNRSSLLTGNWLDFWYLPSHLPPLGASKNSFVWEGKSGRTKVHHMTCPKTRSLSCSCPPRLASGTVDSLLGKLRAIVAEVGLGEEWDDRLGIGNPASHPSIKNYFKSIKEEQTKARVCPKKVVPLFLEKLLLIAQFILS